MRPDEVSSLGWHWAGYWGPPHTRFALRNRSTPTPHPLLQAVRVRRHSTAGPVPWRNFPHCHRSCGVRQGADFAKRSALRGPLPYLAWPTPPASTPSNGLCPQLATEFKLHWAESISAGCQLSAVWRYRLGAATGAASNGHHFFEHRAFKKFNPVGRDWPYHCRPPIEQAPP
jgi:hypothetical protein